MIYDNHLNRDYIIPERERERKNEIREERDKRNMSCAFTNFVPKVNFSFQTIFHRDMQRERDRHVAHPLDDGCPNYLNRTGNKWKLNSKREKRNRFFVLFGGVKYHRGLVADYHSPSIHRRNKFGPLCEKGRPTTTRIITGLALKKGLNYRDECRCLDAKKVSPPFFSPNLTQHSAQVKRKMEKTIIRETL